MRIARILILMAILIGLAACSEEPLEPYDGPSVTSVEVYKSTRSLYLMHGDEVIRSYPFEMGFAPQGHKVFEGDGRTPEGRYYIDRRNPQSQYHLSLGISYPNARD